MFLSGITVSLAGKNALREQGLNYRKLCFVFVLKPVCISFLSAVPDQRNMHSESVGIYEYMILKHTRIKGYCHRK